MGTFCFRLEQVRRYRKQLEEQAMQALAMATAHRAALVEKVSGLEQIIAEQRARLCIPETLQSAERWLAQSYLAALTHDVALARLQLAEADNHVDICRVELLKRAKERGLLDSLRQKQAERHQMRERQQEQKTNDETATLRYKSASI